MSIDIIQTGVAGLYRYAVIIISDGMTSYVLDIGGLPITGDLQTILDARFDELWQVAETKGNQPSLLINLTQEGKQWFESHLSAEQLFTLSMDDIDSLIAAWDLSAIPPPARNELKLLLRALTCSVRILAHQLQLLD